MSHMLAVCLQPQDAYGLEKLASEELARHYDKDFGIECRIARFHNIYGPYGTWKGGREKAPAAFCRKVCPKTSACSLHLCPMHASPLEESAASALFCCLGICSLAMQLQHCHASQPSLSACLHVPSSNALPVLPLAVPPPLADPFCWQLCRC